MKVKSESEVAQSCPTPSDPMDCSLPGSPVPGILQARVLEWGATAFSMSEILRTAVLTTPENLLELQIIWPLPRLTETLRVGAQWCVYE